MSCRCKLSQGNQVTGLPHQFVSRFLSGLPAADLDDILSIATHRQFRASSVVVHQGDPAEQFFLLTSGYGRHFATTTEGQKIILYWISAGHVFGSATILANPMKHIGSTELLSDSCALMWDRQTLRKLVFRFPQLLDNALSIAERYITAFVSAQISLSSDNARGRVAQLLASLAGGIGKSTADGVELKVTNEDLAAGANVTSFTVSRSLSEWQRAGILSKGRGKILLRKPELLAVV